MEIISTIPSDFMLGENSDQKLSKALKAQLEMENFR